MGWSESSDVARASARYPTQSFTILFAIRPQGRQDCGLGAQPLRKTPVALQLAAAWGFFRGKGSMITIANTAVALVAVLHFGFLVLEMFLWTRPLGLRTFGTTPDFARASKALAANQGLYNGFVATGLGWGLILGDAGSSIKIFFLGRVVVAGVFGGFTASRKILWAQALPGAVALALVLLA